MSDDILSGGRVDQSTSGPTPPKTDDRDRDILLEQKEKQDQDAVGGTQFPPKPQPLPPIPEAPEVAPQLPVIPSFDFNISGSALEEIREISRQTTIDVFKNVNINGQGPSIEGSTIAFNVPQQPPASEAFFFQGVVIPQPPEAAPQPPPPIQDVQSVVVAPPSQPVQETPPQERPTRSEERRGVGSEDFGTGGREGFLEAAYTSLSGGVDIDFDDAQRARDAARSRGADIDFDDAQRARDEARGETASARAYEAAEGQRDARREADPNFDRESSVRQRGETPREFRERQEQLRQERAERAQREEQVKRVREGDLTEMPSGMIPVRFTRADGQKKILALMATELVGVVEGAEAGERTLPLPAEDSYYEGGGGGSDRYLFKIEIESIPNTSPPQSQIKINTGVIAFLGGPAGESAGTPQLTIDPKDNVFIYVKANFETSSFTLEHSSSVPLSSNNIRYFTIGYVGYSNNQYITPLQFHLGVLYLKFSDKTGQFLFWDSDGAKWRSSDEPPSGKKAILYWDFNRYRFLEEPEGNGFFVLTYSNGNYAWSETTDCQEVLN